MLYLFTNYPIPDYPPILDLPLGRISEGIRCSLETFENPISDGSGVHELLEEEHIVVIGACLGAQRHGRWAGHGRVRRALSRYLLFLTGKAGDVESGRFGAARDDQLVVGKVETKHI